MALAMLCSVLLFALATPEAMPPFWPISLALRSCFVCSSGLNSRPAWDCVAYPPSPLENKKNRRFDNSERRLLLN